MKNETTMTKNASDIAFEIGSAVAMEVFGAPFQYLPWNEKLACRIVAAFVLVRSRFAR